MEDVFVQNRRIWVRLRENGGKGHAMPCPHNLEEYLIAYLDGCRLRDDPKGPLFRTIPNRGGQLTATPLPQASAHAMIRRRAAGARIDTKVGNHTFGRPASWRISKMAARSKRRRHGEPRLDPHNAALRSPARRGESRRGGADFDISDRKRSKLASN